MLNKIKNWWAGLRGRGQTLGGRGVKLMERHSLLSFFGLLLLLLGLIVLGNYLRRPPEAAEVATPEPKTVQTYNFGQSPTMTFTAKVEKSGVINIYAQSPGIVSQIKVEEGDHVKRGSSLVWLSTSYQGGNTASLSRQIAQKNYDFANENFDTQKDIINRQKDLANKGEMQAAEMREITRQSVSSTRSLIDLTNDIIGRIDTQITALEASNVNGVNDGAILAAKQGKLGAQSGLTQLQSGLRTAEYQSNEATTPAQTTRASRDLTIRQLELQEKSLGLSKDLSLLNLKLARVTESLMYPAAPCAGTVERVYVKPGQSVNPGTLIATIKADQTSNTAVMLVPANIAPQISDTEPSHVSLGGHDFELYPRYISIEATDGTLHSVLYDLPEETDRWATNGGLLEVSVPLGTRQIVVNDLFVPLDAVYQTQDAAYISIVSEADGQTKAKTIPVTLGEVSGAYIKVESGLSANDRVITSRNVQDGDVIKL